MVKLYHVLGLQACDAMLVDVYQKSSKNQIFTILYKSSAVLNHK